MKNGMRTSRFDNVILEAKNVHEAESKWPEMRSNESRDRTRRRIRERKINQTNEKSRSRRKAKCSLICRAKRQQQPLISRPIDRQLAKQKTFVCFLWVRFADESICRTCRRPWAKIAQEFGLCKDNHLDRNQSKPVQVEEKKGGGRNVKKKRSCSVYIGKRVDLEAPKTNQLFNY